jgi:hypothetical protein
LAALRRIEARNAIETAHRALQICGQVFRYAIATGRTERDITLDLRGSLMQAKAGHFSAVTEPKQTAELLRTIDSYTGTFVVKSALQTGTTGICPPWRTETSRMGAYQP